MEPINQPINKNSLSGPMYLEAEGLKSKGRWMKGMKTTRMDLISAGGSGGLEESVSPTTVGRSLVGSHLWLALVSALCLNNPVRLPKASSELLKENY